MRDVVVTNGKRIAGVVGINTGLWHGFTESGPGITFGDVAVRNFTLAREQDVAFVVITRMWRRDAITAIVRSEAGRLPRTSDVVAIIAKAHVADAVAGSVQVYPR
jgi:chloride channel protein, CIC family